MQGHHGQRQSKDGQGRHKDEQGQTTVLKAVKKAEEFRLANETTKSYIGLAGNLEYCQKMEQLLLGDAHPALLADRVRTAQAPGGNGAASGVTLLTLIPRTS